MIILGVILLVLFYLVVKIQIVFIVGVILLVVGATLLLMNAVGGRQIGGRSHWY